MSLRITDPVRLRALLGTDAETELSAGRRHWSFHRSGPAGAASAVLLVSGLGMHRIEWSAELIHHLHSAGHQTIAVDNHDAGRSFLRVEEQYSLKDLAQDLVDFLVLLELPAVHVVGISMGGMLAQHVALIAPERTLTLTSLASTTGRRGVGRPAERSKWIFRTTVPTDREEYIDYVQRHHLSITSDDHRDLERVRWVGEQVWRRGLNPAGVTRQLAAIAADGDRTERLLHLVPPTLVIHGDRDPMIDVSGGIQTAAAVPGSELVVIPGMGHVVTWQIAREVARRLTTHFARHEGAARPLSEHHPS